MAEDFYEQWLNVPYDHREPGETPNHYDLLGLPCFCHHAGAVEEAARLQLVKLDKYALHPNKTKRDQCSRMMNEVARARVTLSDPKNFEGYDQRLSKQLAIEIPTQEVTPPDNLIRMEDAGAILDIGNSSQAPRDQGNLVALDASLAAQEGPAIQAHADILGDHSAGAGFGASGNKSFSPKMLAIIIGSIAGVMILVVVLVVMLVPSTTKKIDGEVANQPAASSTTQMPTNTSASSQGPAKSKPKLVVATKVPITKRTPDFIEKFERHVLGTSYAVRASEGQGAKIVEHQMQMEIEGNYEGSVRVRFEPENTPEAFENTQFDLLLDPSATFVFTAAGGAIKLELTRSDAGLEVRASPGTPSGKVGAMGWPILEVGADALKIRATRAHSAIEWRINEQLVALSPDILPRNGAYLEFMLMGAGGTKAVVSGITLHYLKK